MSKNTVKELAQNAGVPVTKVMERLKKAGEPVESENEVLNNDQNLLFLRIKDSILEEEQPDNLKAIASKDKITIKDIQGAESLRELNYLLTQAMAKLKIQGLIKGDSLDTVIDSILELAEASPVDEELLAMAMLGRLAAVARGRRTVVTDRVSEILTMEPLSIESLDDGDAKLYASSMLRYVSQPWVSEYSHREAILIDTADNARRELLSACLEREECISDWLNSITALASKVTQIESLESRLKRVRRIFASISDVAYRWKGEVGNNIGDALAGCQQAFLKTKLLDEDQELIFETLDNLMSVLRRVIELRFSMAMHAKTYSIIEAGKKLIGPGIWGRYVDQSDEIKGLRVSLLEASLVLARQGRTDRNIMAVLVALYTSRPQVKSAVKKHFADARDLDPDVMEWWSNAGDVSERKRKVEQSVGNNEDSQIGALLIEVESNRDAMDKVGRAVVLYLEISEPVLASTVRKAVSGYTDIAQIAGRLARMRKLTKTDLKGGPIEYNPMEHEMLGGHKPGIRRIQVVREGVKKNFSGKIKTLVKPWVEPYEE